MKRIATIVVLILLEVAPLLAQPQINIVSGKRDTVYTARHFIRGLTSPDCSVSVNGNPATVYNTGAFAAEVTLNVGSNDVVVAGKRGIEETVNVLRILYIQPEKPKPTSTFIIEEAKVFPENISMVSPRDIIKIRVKTLPNSEVSWLNGKPLYELPLNETDGLEGIYQGQYVVKENDRLFDSPITVTMKNGGRSISQQVLNMLTVLDADNPTMVRSAGPNPYLNYGLGTDRLGGSKIGYIVPGITMQVASKVGSLYKVQLSKRHYAWIPNSQVELVETKGIFRPESLTSTWRVFGEGKYDYVYINLSERLAYRSFQQINPSRIVVDLYGATTNTAWITQFFSLKEIKNVNYEQIEDDVLRIFIDLNNKQHWGYGIYYQDNMLVIRVKHQPKLALKGMHIAIDAGHGGTSLGAVGTTGLTEKEVNLTLTKMLKAELEKRGAKITLTRSDDVDISMTDRILMLRELEPDILISMHNNAGGSPLTTKGSSTYYRHIGYRPLSVAILKKILELSVENYGNVGGFNFSLSSPTEFPNVLVEGLFMSSPEDEAKLIDNEFKQKLVRKIADGLNDFIINANK
ncbi:MAG: N-acetylmuramoyl-L-alanine amidase [Prevotellaceae bacterium]|jgi:N-acetylmuramoyl-L-alanine amidase|nr:N-acetylmuramoyl-L-alanine amidase [Prevotellaceae bacterium]